MAICSQILCLKGVHPCSVCTHTHRIRHSESQKLRPGLYLSQILTNWHPKRQQNYSAVMPLLCIHFSIIYLGCEPGPLKRCLLAKLLAPLQYVLMSQMNEKVSHQLLSSNLQRSSACTDESTVCMLLAASAIGLCILCELCFFAGGEGTS